MLDQNYYSYMSSLIKALIVFMDLLGQIQIMESSCNRFGLGSSLYAKCSGCGTSEFLATGSHSQDDVNPRALQGKDVNRRRSSLHLRVRMEEKELPNFVRSSVCQP